MRLVACRPDVIWCRLIVPGRKIAAGGPCTSAARPFGRSRRIAMRREWPIGPCWACSTMSARAVVCLLVQGWKSPASVFVGLIAVLITSWVSARKPYLSTSVSCAFLNPVMIHSVMIHSPPRRFSSHPRNRPSPRPLRAQGRRGVRGRRRQRRSHLRERICGQQGFVGQA